MYERFVLFFFHFVCFIISLTVKSSLQLIINQQIINQEIFIILQVASPSIDSFSTLPDQEISDFQTDSRDLQVKVDNPQKHLETLETYITFRITTRVWLYYHNMILISDNLNNKNNIILNNPADYTARV